MKHIPLGVICKQAKSNKLDKSLWEKDCQIVASLLATKKQISLQAIDVNDNGTKDICPIPNREAASEVQVVIPFHNRSDITIKCLESLKNQDISENLFITLVDNCSSETESNIVSKAASRLKLKHRIIYDKGYFNFARLNNIATSESQSPFILFLNNDVVLDGEHVISEMLSWSSLDDVGLVGGTLRYPNGQIQHAGINFSSVRPANVSLKEQFAHLFREVDGVCFAMALIRREVFDEVGALDELNCPNGFGDTLYCSKLKDKGFRILHTPRATAIHHESISRGRSVEDIELWDMERNGLEIADLKQFLGYSHQPQIIKTGSVGHSPHFDSLIAWIKRSTGRTKFFEALSKLIFLSRNKIKKLLDS